MHDREPNSAVLSVLYLTPLRCTHRDPEHLQVIVSTSGALGGGWEAELEWGIHEVIYMSVSLKLQTSLTYT